MKKLFTTARCWCKASLMVTICGAVILAPFNHSQAGIVTWDGGAGGGTAWISTSNWDIASTPTGSDIAIFSTVGTATGIGINFNGSTNNGTAAQIIGQITQSGGVNRAIGNSSSTVDGVLTIAGVGGVLINNTSTNSLTLAPAVNSATKAMEVRFGSVGELQVTSSGLLTISAVIGGTNGFIKTGSGTLILSGANTYVGTTTINQGVLQVGSNGAGSTGIGALTLASGATLYGSGTVRGNNSIEHVINGILRPGDRPGSSSTLGTLTFEGDLTMSTTTETYFELGSPLSLYDSLVGSVPGTTAILDGLMKVDFSGYTPSAGDMWKLFDWTTLSTGAFNIGNTFRSGANGIGEGDLDLPDVGTLGLEWNLTDFAALGTIRLQAVPEPRVAAMIALGLLPISLRRRRV